MSVETVVAKFEALKPIAGSPSDRHFTVYGIADFLGKGYPPRDQILAPWLPVQGLCMIYAKRGVGKTFLALGIAYAVASGGDVLRWRAPHPRGVLFIDGEMPAAVTQERLAAIAAASALEPRAPLRIMPVDDQRHGIIDLSSVEDQALLEPHLEGVDLVIVDNISTCCRSGRENEAEGWIPVQEWALKLRARGKSVLFLHHAGKGGAQRGTSKREDILDTVIALRQPGDYDPATGAQFEVHFEKNRGIYGDDVKPFISQLGADAHGRQCWTMQDLEESTFDRCVELHREGLKGIDIAEVLDIHKSNVSRHLAKAKREGLLDG